MNTRTLVATFNDYSTANQAARELEKAGIKSDAVDIDSNQKTVGAGSTGTYQNDEQQSGFSGWWNSLFGSDTDDSERKGYEGALAAGGTILRATVPVESMDTAADILNRHGAVDIDRSSASTGNITTDASKSTARTGDSAPLQVVQEELQVGKRAIQRGGVRIYSHIVSEPVQEQVKLREEHVNVVRRPVNREISTQDVSALRDQTIEVTEMAEEAVVAKRARVVEEVVIGKQSTERTETVRDNVRRTEVEVEQLETEAQTSGSSSVKSSASGSATPTGLSPNKPAPGAMSGFGSTAGAGTLAGQTTAGSAGQDFTSDYRKNFETTFGSGSDFESARPSYEYGYRSASDARYKGKSWAQVENDLRSDFESRNPGSKWEQTKSAVRYGWEKVTGQR